MRPIAAMIPENMGDTDQAKIELYHCPLTTGLRERPVDNSFPPLQKRRET
jgi:hypothetical protein